MEDQLRSGDNFLEFPDFGSAVRASALAVKELSKKDFLKSHKKTGIVYEDFQALDLNTASLDLLCKMLQLRLIRYDTKIMTQKCRILS